MKKLVLVLIVSLLLGSLTVSSVRAQDPPAKEEKQTNKTDKSTTKEANKEKKGKHKGSHKGTHKGSHKGSHKSQKSK